MPRHTEEDKRRVLEELDRQVIKRRQSPQQPTPPPQPPAPQGFSSLERRRQEAAAQESPLEGLRRNLEARREEGRRGLVPRALGVAGRAIATPARLAGSPETPLLALREFFTQPPSLSDITDFSLPGQAPTRAVREQFERETGRPLPEGKGEARRALDEKLRTRTLAMQIIGGVISDPLLPLGVFGPAAAPGAAARATQVARAAGAGARTQRAAGAVARTALFPEEVPLRVAGRAAAAVARPVVGAVSRGAERLAPRLDPRLRTRGSVTAGPRAVPETPPLLRTGVPPSSRDVPLSTVPALRQAGASRITLESRLAGIQAPPPGLQPSGLELPAPRGAIRGEPFAEPRSLGLAPGASSRQVRQLVQPRPISTEVVSEATRRLEAIAPVEQAVDRLLVANNPNIRLRNVLDRARAQTDQGIRARPQTSVGEALSDAPSGRLALVSPLARAEPSGVGPPHAVPRAPENIQAPAPGQAAVLPELPTVEEALATGFVDNYTRRVGAAFARIPGIESAFGRQINPSLLAKKPSTQAVIAYGEILDASETASKAAVTQLRALGRDVWVLDDVGRALNVGIPEGQSPFLGDILTVPDRYGLTPVQQQWVGTWRSLREQRLAQMRARGVKIEEIQVFDDPATGLSFDVEIPTGAALDGEWFPRIVIGKKRADEGILGRIRGPIRRSLGARQTQQRPRRLRSVQQGVEKQNLVYVTDPNEVVELTLRASYRAEADADLIRFLKGQPDVRVGKPGTAGFGEFQFGQEAPGLQNVIVPEDLAQAINQAFNESGIDILRGLSSLNDASRFLTTGLDPGFIFIQGQLALVRRPIRWARTTALSFRALLDPDVYSKYIRDNLPVAQKMVEARMAPLSSSEYTQATRSGFLRLGIAQRAALAFDTFLDVSRMELLKGLGGLRLAGQELRDLGNVVDHMVGVSSSRALGVSPIRRQVEGSLFLFAPRYRRAGAALGIDALQGGIRGDQARKALASFLLGGMAFMTAMAYATGQEDRVLPRASRPIPPMFDPRGGKFFSLNVGGTEIGIGGSLVSTMRIFGRLYSGVRREGIAGLLGAGVDSLRSLTSPVSSTAADILTKSNFFGEPTLTLRGILRMITNRTLPFYVEPYVSEGLLSPDEPLPGPERGIAGALGLREFPEGASTILDEAALEQHGALYRELEPFQRFDIRTGLGDTLQRLNRRGAGLGRRRDQYNLALSGIDDDRTGRLNGLLQDLTSGPGSRGVAARVYLDIESDASASRQQAASDFQQEFEDGDETSSDLNKRALAQYYKALSESRTAGGSQFIERTFNQLIRSFNWSREQQQFVDRNTNLRLIPPELLPWLPGFVLTNQDRSNTARDRFNRRQRQQR